MEAKNTKSYDTLQITARFISNQELMTLVKPFSEKLSTLSSFKNITKIKAFMILNLSQIFSRWSNVIVLSLIIYLSS